MEIGPLGDGGAKTVSKFLGVGVLLTLSQRKGQGKGTRWGLVENSLQVEGFCPKKEGK